MFEKMSKYKSWNEFCEWLKKKIWNIIFYSRRWESPSRYT